jgi:hypothetical protein
VRQGFKSNYIFFIQQNCGDEMFFELYKMVNYFCFNHLVVGVAHKLFRIKGHDLHLGKQCVAQ